MAIDPNIALGYRPIQIEQRNPLAEYAQIQNIQTGQLQNQLARQQMEQEQGAVNYLGRADLSTPEGRAGLRQFGKTGLGYEKLIADQEMNALKRQELESKVRDQRMSALGTGLTSVMNDPSDAKLTSALDNLEATGVKVGDLRTRLLGMPADQRKAEITQYVSAHPEGRQALAFVQPKPIQVKRGDGSIIFLDENPNSPTFKQEVMPPQAAGMSPFEEARIPILRQTANAATANANTAAQRAAIAQQELDRKVAGGELKPVPVHAQKAITGAAASIGQLSDAIDLLKGLEVSGQKGSKSATGLKAYAPDIALNRLDPAGTVTRAAIADIGSMIMHDRSGAAVTVSESPRLKPFIPLTTDDAATALKKLERLRKIQLDDSEALTSTYNPEQGFKSFKAPIRSGMEKPATPNLDDLLNKYK